MRMKTFGCALIAIAQVKGQDSAKPPSYGHGSFPSGQLYAEGDLQNFVGKTFSEPAYLTDRFVYLGNIQGKETFSNYRPGLLKEGSTAFGHILIEVKSYDNRPPGLKIGKAIVANARRTIDAQKRETGKRWVFNRAGQELVYSIIEQ